MYGYRGLGINAGSPLLEITSSYPQLTGYYGLLSGAGFSISYAIAGIVWGIAADKYNRKLIVSLACIGWSLTSYFTGAINSFSILVAMRFLLGVTQGALEPGMYSIIPDYFPKSKTTTANSIVSASQYLGAGLSSMSIMIIATAGWRAALKAMGVFGIAIGAAGLLFMREPERDVFKKYDDQCERDAGREPVVQEKPEEDESDGKNLVQNFA